MTESMISVTVMMARVVLGVQNMPVITLATVRQPEGVLMDVRVEDVSVYAPPTLTEMGTFTNSTYGYSLFTEFDSDTGSYYI
jgi:hypothetical protein